MFVNSKEVVFQWDIIFEIYYKFHLYLHVRFVFSVVPTVQVLLFGLLIQDSYH